jgi:peptidoglycan/LPS O-acetylase OafA/YrhL
MSERFENINLLRAFAAIAVVVYHVIEYGQWTAFPREGPLLVFRIGWIGVDLFFVISGFVIARSALGMWRQDPEHFPSRYAVRRIARIVPLYLLTCVLWVAFFKPDFFEPPATHWLWQIGAHATFTHTFWPSTYGSIVGVNWTLGIEMQFYLLVALLVPWLARTPAWRIYIACVLVTWTWRGTMYYFFGHYEPVRLFTRLMQLPGVLDEFGAGIVLAKLVDRRPAPQLRDGFLWVAAAIVAGTASMSVYWRNTSYFDIPAMAVLWRSSLGVFFLPVVAAAVYLPSVAMTWPLRPIRYLGVISYGIYLWHLFAIMLWPSNPRLPPLELLGFTLGLTVLFAAASWHFFEKPILDYGRRFRPRAHGHEPAPANRADA